MRRFIFSLISLTVFVSVSYSQEGVYKITNYTTKDYGREFNPANFCITQDPRGVIYAGNGNRLLEFDGKFWNSYSLPKDTWILSLAQDRTGRIFIGSSNEFGFFQSDETGDLRYSSLSDSLEPEDKDFTTIRYVSILNNRVAFLSEEKLFIYANNKIRTIQSSATFHTSCLVNNKLFIRERGTGLLELQGDSLISVPGGEIFAGPGIFFMLPFGRQRQMILIGTGDEGFWIFDPKSETPFRKFLTDNPKVYNTSGISGGVITSDGSFAISTLRNGLMILDTCGVTKNIINTSNGLADNEIKQVISDRNNNLWLAMNRGIATVEVSSPLSVSGEKSGLPGSINSIIRYNNALFAGTSSGLFISRSKPGDNIEFVPVNNITAQVRSLAVAEKMLFVGTDEGLFRISGEKPSRISENRSWALLYDPDRKILLSGGSGGLSSFYIGESIEKKNIKAQIPFDIISIAKQKTPSKDSSVYWIVSRQNNIVRLKLYSDKEPETDIYDKYDGITGGLISASSTDSSVTILTLTGLFGFKDEKRVKEELPDSLKNNKDFLRGEFASVKISSDSIPGTVTLMTEAYDKLWISAGNIPGYINLKNDKNFVNQPFLGIEVGKINMIYPEENGVCWFATTDGLIKYNEAIKKNYNQQFETLIRKVHLLSTNSVLSYDSVTKTDTSATAEKVLEYRDNSIRFEFSAPFYEYPEKLRYSYWLEGYEHGWGPLKDENYQEYTNLKEGRYTFRVKAFNVFGRESTTASFTFVVAPPWFRTPLAYIIYITTSVLLIWFFARLYSYRLKKENIRLEGIVEERTSEIVRQKGVIEKKNVVLEHQNKEIEDSIRYAKRIQSAVIPSEKDCLKILPESFVFFRPLNIVSGDFYWISRAGRKVIFTAADCTGHGVPGAFMSMLGVAFLNEIVNKDQVFEPELILNSLRCKVISALQQQGITGETRDGMDIAIVSIDEERSKLTYAGAYNSLIMIRNCEISEFDADNMPIGIYDKMDSFTSKEIRFEKGDVFYMYSDGYEDQFGGPEGKKFKSKNFKRMLLEISSLPMKEQKEIIEKRFDEWKGSYNQIDDIVVTGFRL